MLAHRHRILSELWLRGVFLWFPMPAALTTNYSSFSQYPACMNQDVTHSQHSTHLQLATKAYPVSDVYVLALLYLE